MKLKLMKYMKNSIKFNIVLLFSIILNNGIQAERVHIYETPSGGGGNKTIKSIAAGCLAAAGASELYFNNVKCRIMTGGDVWRNNDEAGYFIPANTKKTSLFAGALWIGGIDINGQLKVAALRFRQVGNDFWPGPLTVDGTASIEAPTCIAYDKINTIYRKDVDEFLLHQNNPSLNPNYEIPSYFYEYPAHPLQTVPLWEKMSHYLAPFKDVNGDGEYNPDDGDYPYYDVTNELCPRNLENIGKPPAIPAEGIGILADQVLKGDQTLWWVFNDKGNSHSESSGQPIGFEIRAQAFAFSTNDEINNMTFYSYEIINRSTYELSDTYFSQWVDPDLGFSNDDYIGCDVVRGLGYCYNGKPTDGSGLPAQYGLNPPAVGVDFFQGPYMDPNGKDDSAWNKLRPFENCNAAINGVNFGDGIVDNERFGMRRFLYHNNGGPAWFNDPSIAIDYYNLLRGRWGDGTKMTYGGQGHLGTVEADFMFPGLSDLCGWGTGGVVQPNWTEESSGNLPWDRRILQSAGPFTLKSGAVNYITVGIPWARTTSGGPLASVELLKQADDKCQTLFDNCFKVIDGPTAPDLSVQELDKELIFYLTNTKGSNNYIDSLEDYHEYDPTIISPNDSTHWDSTYDFQGYQIYQLVDNEVSANDLENSNKARLVFQCDIKDTILDIINFETDATTGMLTPKQKVVGANNKGIVHSFRILTDKFAPGTSNKLINHKQYYFMAVAYGYNEYMKFALDPPELLKGQKKPYLSGRKNLRVTTGIPHNSTVENNGTIIRAPYGFGPKITRIQGQGNGGQFLELTKESIDNIMNSSSFKIQNPEYENNKGPINVKVIDPLGVKAGDFIVKFKNVIYNSTDNTTIKDANWDLIKLGDRNDTINSEKSIKIENEQLFLDLGISITIGQCLFPGKNPANNGYLGSSITYADSLKPWLNGVGDADGYGDLDWINSGTGSSYDQSGFYSNLIPISSNTDNLALNGTGTWAPYILSNSGNYGPAGSYAAIASMEYLHSVDLIFTSDKSKWTRCPVMETCFNKILSEGNAKRFTLRKAHSVDKEGNPDNTPTTGMGWFPGYAINIETGERLNLIFGENSWLTGENGRDMKFNPTSNFLTPIGDIIWGGQHFVYIVNHSGDGPDDSPGYDEGVWLASKISSTSVTEYRLAFKNIMWTGIPMASKNYPWMSCDAKISFRVERPYKKYLYGNSPKDDPTGENNYAPMYKFNTNDLATVFNDNATAKSALDLINVVPNPYYAYSSTYETSQLDNRIKFVNLPVKCVVSIYTLNGTLIRQFTKDSDITSLDWDLKNSVGIPVAGGVYLIHVKADGIGEKIIKWFGIMRPVDLNSF